MIFNQEFVDKINNYSLENASNILRKPKKNKQVIQLAKEAAARTLEKLWKASLKGTITEKKDNDNYYFIASKFGVYDQITWHDRKGRIQYKDFNNISLNKKYIDEIDLELENKDRIELENKERKEEIINSKLKLIEDILRSSEYLDKMDLELFRYRHLDGLNVKKIMKKVEISEYEINLRFQKIRNVMQFEFKNNSF